MSDMGTEGPAADHWTITVQYDAAGNIVHQQATCDARSAPRPWAADQLRWHEPPRSTADAFAAESDAEARP